MELKLDAKDRKILEQQEINARQSNSQIAKKVGLSKDAVAYRIRNLEEKGLIKGYYSVLNISRLGYQTYKLMLTFQNTNSKIEDEIIAYLDKIKNSGWIVSCDGQYNLLAVFWVKTSSEFDKIMLAFLKRYSKYLKRRDVILITENSALRKGYLFDKQIVNRRVDSYSGEEKEKLDKKDIQIISELSNNSKIPLYEISEKVGLTAEAIAHRIKKLQKEGVLQSFRPIIDSSRLGYEYYNVLFKLKRFDNLERIFTFLMQQPNIIYFVKYLGEYDLGIDLEVENPEQLRKIIQNIRDTFSEDIETYISILVYKEHKISYFPE